jgi:hypothetical protein
MYLLLLNSLRSGESDLIPQLAGNCVRNESIGSVPTSCQQLWWGEGEALDVFKLQHPLGFDLIIGTSVTTVMTVSANESHQEINAVNV